VNSREFAQYFNDYPPLQELEREIIAGKTRFGAPNAIGSFKSILISHLFLHTNRSIMVCCNNLEDAEYYYSDLLVFTDTQHLFLWKDSFRKTFDISAPEAIKIQANASVLDHLSDTDTPKIVITYPEALAERIIEQVDFEKSKIVFKIGEEVDLDFLIEILNEYHFFREDFVYEPGQFSIRGGIIDLYSYASELPFRLELDGRTIESIREFDPVSQLSTKKLVRATVVPNVQESKTQHTGTDIYTYLGKKPICCFVDLPYTIAKIEKGVEKARNTVADKKWDEIYFSEEEILNIINSKQVIEFSSQTFYKPSVKLSFNQTAQPPINKNFNLLIDTLKSLVIKKHLYFRKVQSK
jgi:transcription-repair coupling factor (superfamily II helicase)